MDSFHVPSIMDFVRLRAEERRISKEETIYARKLKIAEVSTQIETTRYA